MTATKDGILEAVRSLPPDERIEVADAIYHEHDVPEFDDEFNKELDRRSQAIDDGTAVLRTWDEVKARILSGE